MISLNLKAEFHPSLKQPFVVKLSRSAGEGHAVLVGEFENSHHYALSDETFQIELPLGEEIVGDIVFCNPERGIVSRWLRSNSLHNTLLVTEQCDQLCIMCSQPPKASHTDLFSYFQEACELAPPSMTIGFSGGEPTLYKEQLFDLFEHLHAVRPDLDFHVLTNGQHFEEEDVARLRKPAFRSVVWGVPLYSNRADIHDAIVAKPGAFERLMPSLSRMARSGLNIELRTVLLQQNYQDLEQLAWFITNRLPFISVWALMQLERIGFARNRWGQQFVDHSADLAPLMNAVSLSSARGIEAVIYNAPHCSVSSELRPYLNQSISDWKRAFAPECDACSKKAVCSGFFEWHVDLADYAMGGRI